ncbi:MAG: Na+/H+ antiporter subunit E [Microthrixaceae bacterium]
MITKVFMVAWLTTVWILLWGDLSPANFLAGIALAVALILLFPPSTAQHGGVHLAAVIRFVLWFSKALVLSNLTVAKEVGRPRIDIEPGIVAVPLRACSPLVAVFVANAITLTPGTLTVDVRPQAFGRIGGEPAAGHLQVRNGVTVPPVLYVHCLKTGDPEQVRADGLELEEFVVRAFGSPEDRLAILQPPSVWPPASQQGPLDGTHT